MPVDLGTQVLLLDELWRDSIALLVGFPPAASILVCFHAFVEEIKGGQERVWEEEHRGSPSVTWASTATSQNFLAVFLF